MSEHYSIQKQNENENNFYFENMFIYMNILTYGQVEFISAIFAAMLILFYSLKICITHTLALSVQFSYVKWRCSNELTKKNRKTNIRKYWLWWGVGNHFSKYYIRCLNCSKKNIAQLN